MKLWLFLLLPLTLIIGILIGLALPRQAKSYEVPVTQEMVDSNVLKGDPSVAMELYNKWLKTQPTHTGYDVCSCVSFAKATSGINVGPIGMAKNHPINSQTPEIGEIVITNESPAGHLAVVTAVDNSTITVSEANYIPCKTDTRTLKKTSPVIRGYYY